ncbi:hypothetical protein [Maridesulfovibrio bastinii]|uniref:hypothetical protein n=1 Tax=Maridesulfovibrio bastinii TaxID=47157 RepID=UPI0004049B0A|nr:hypothetical protein [Maridesulfovibrio bastinii]
MQKITSACSQKILSLTNSWKGSEQQNASPSFSSLLFSQPIANAADGADLFSKLEQDSWQGMVQKSADWDASEFLHNFFEMQMAGYNHGDSGSSDEISVSSSSGTTVSLKIQPPDIFGNDAGVEDTYSATVTTVSGLQFDLEISDDARITDTDDGGVSVTFRGSGEVHIYDASGNKTVRKDSTDTFTGTDRDDIFINLRGSEVDGGAGNDSIINFADNATLRGGDGDDEIILARSVAGNTIATGPGNDSLRGHDITASHVDMGEGDNSVEFNNLGQGSSMTLGDGNNKIDIGNVWNGSSVKIGNGDNQLDIRGIRNNSSVIAGSGDNFLKTNGIHANSSILFGDGNNEIDTTRVSENSSIAMGNGNNVMDAVYVTKNSAIKFGDGNNEIGIQSVSDQSAVIIGNGNNEIDTDSVWQGSSMTVGDGNNKISTELIKDECSVTIGDGNNQIKSRSVDDSSSLTIGNGNNDLDIIGVKYNSSVTLGSGDNFISIYDVSRQSEININNKNNQTNISRIRSSIINAGSDKRYYSLGRYIKA